MELQTHRESTGILPLFSLSFLYSLISQCRGTEAHQSQHSEGEKLSPLFRRLGFNRVEPISIAFFPPSILPLPSPGHTKAEEVQSKTEKQKHQLISQGAINRSQGTGKYRRGFRERKKQTYKVVYELLSLLLSCRYINLILLSIPKIVRSKLTDKSPPKPQICQWVVHM